MMMGFPVLRKQANVLGTPGRCCGFTKCEAGDANYPGRSRFMRVRNEMINQAGNSICVPAAGFIELYVMLFANLRDETTLLVPSSSSSSSD